MKINLSTILLWSHAVSCVDGFTPILPFLRTSNHHVVSLRMASAAGAQHQEAVSGGGAKQAPSVDDPK